jgi:hypothetical protein
MIDMVKVEGEMAPVQEGWWEVLLAVQMASCQRKSTPKARLFRKSKGPLVVEWLLHRWLQ